MSDTDYDPVLGLDQTDIWGENNLKLGLKGSCLKVFTRFVFKCIMSQGENNVLHFVFQPNIGLVNIAFL